MTRGSPSGLLLLVLLAAPAAASQSADPGITVRAFRQGGETSIRPEVESARFLVIVQVRCNGAEAGGATEVELSSEASHRVAVSIEPSRIRKTTAQEPCTIDRPPSPQDPGQTFNASAVVVAHLTAPAYQDQEVKLLARVTKTNAAGASSTYPAREASVTIRAAFLPLLEVTPSLTVQRVKPGGFGEYPVSIMNRGNGPTLVTLEPVPTAAAPAELDAGPELRLKSVATDGEDSPWRSERTIRATATNRPGLYGFGLRFNASFDGKGSNETATVVVLFSLEVQSAWTVPGPGLTASVPILAACLAVRRRRQ